MAGRMGGENVVMKRLKVVKIIAEDNIMLIKGAVPGRKKGLVMITKNSKGVK